MIKKIILIFSLVIIAGTCYGIFKFYDISKNLKEKIEIVVYLYDAADTASIKNAMGQFKEISKINFVSKDDAVEMLKKEMGEDSGIFNAIKINPIPNSFIVTIKGVYASPATFEKMSSSIRSITGVEEVNYEKRFANKILSLIRLAEKIMLIASAVIIFYCAIVLSTVFGPVRTLTHIK